MRQYTVLYRIESVMTPLDAPFGFQCHADDSEHAEEQCINAYPDCDVVWAHEGPHENGYNAALEDFWRI